MDASAYVDGQLVMSGVDLRALAQRVGTPTYVYSAPALRDGFRAVREAFAKLVPGRDPLVCFAVKSCPNLSVLRVLAGLGAGMDVVSGGELARARAAGVPDDRIVFAGVGKSDDDIRAALVGEPGSAARGPIGQFNIESEAEFRAIASLAQALGVRARGAVRVNPDIDPGPGTHRYTATGLKHTKFGVDIRRARTVFDQLGGHPFLKLSGLHVHLGSPVLEPDAYAQAARQLVDLMTDLEQVGHRIESINLGGGFGAAYPGVDPPDVSDYADAIASVLAPVLAERQAAGRPVRLIVEPGRCISAPAGVLLTRVRFVKESGARKFVICDAGMHTLVRPALYSAKHFIWPAAVAPQHSPPSLSPAAMEPSDLPGLERCDVVGPICETGDFLSLDCPLPPVAPGDVLAVFAAGAYGASMSSRYNSHPLPAEVLIDRPDPAHPASITIARPRESHQDLLAPELNPERLDAPQSS